MTKPAFRIVLLMLFSIIAMVDSKAQTNYSSQNWFFGSSVYGMRFNRPGQMVALDSTNMAPPFGRFGNSTANQPETGNLLFYTDGQFVYDGDFQLMDGIVAGNPAFQLNADINKNQNTAVVGVPGDSVQYYVFTNTPGNSINFSTIDMSSPGNAVFPQPALGSVISFNNSIAASTAITSDALLVVAKSDLSGYWLVTVDQNSNQYKVLDINGASPSAWTESAFTLGTALITAANLSYSPTNNKIAVSPKNQNTNVQILDLNTLTGTLSFDREVLNSGFADLATESVYDTEWSPDGTKLYISRFGGSSGTGDLLQWDLNAPPSTSLVSILPSTVFGSYGLQIGPDDNIYHLYQAINGGPFLVAQLSDADSLAASVNYLPTAFNSQDFNSQQFPSLVPPRQIMFSLDFTIAGTCANVPTTFYPIISPPADSVTWRFGDMTASSNFLSPIHTYTQGGTFTVDLVARLNGQSQIVQKTINISAFDLQLNLVQDTVACQCELPKYGPTCTPFSVMVTASGQSASSVSYMWSNGDFGQTLTPDSAGYYYVVATDGLTGCSTYAGVNVQEYGAQDMRANIWYFGQNAGIDFNPPTGPVALDDSQMNAPEGCTAVSDRNGQVVFYTDGNDVFIKDKVTGVHTLVETGIGGSPGSSQSTMGIAFPNDETLYYIFTTEEVGTGTGMFALKYSVFDIKVNDIVEKNITLFTKSTERLTANNNWVVIHEYGNSNFRAYQLTPNGLSSPVVSSMGSDHMTSSPEQAQGYMKFSSNNTKLAVALANGPNGPSFLEVFDWDDNLGKVTDVRRLNLAADGGSGQVYGVEFSPGSNKLFATVKRAGGPSVIMEYRADTLSKIRHIANTSDGNELGAIQIGPDGQMYVAVQGSTNLGTILADEDTARASVYNPSGFALAVGTSSQLGLPNFAQNTGSAQSTPGYSVSGPVCLGQPIFLNAQTSSIIDTAFWQITDITNAVVYTSQNLTDTVTLSASGDFLVSLIIGNRCGFNTAFSQTVTVNPPPQTSTLPAGLPLCGNSTLLDTYTTPPANIADLNFLWSTGATTQAITVSTIGTYTVTVTDTTSGCTTQASVFVGPPFTVDLGPDQNLCENNPLILDSQANASVYTWLINGTPVVPPNNQRMFDFGAQALPAGSYTVRVEVEDPVDPTCLVVDESIITVDEIPVFNASEGSPVTTCGGSDGVLRLDITSSGNFTYSVTGPVAITNQLVTGPVNNFTIPGLPVGVYAIVLTNNVSTCTQQASNVNIKEPSPFTIQNVSTTNDDCAGGNGAITFELDNVIAPINYTLRDQVTLTNPPVTGSFAGGTGPGLPVTINGLTAGTYSLEVTDFGGGCTSLNGPISIAPTPVTDLQVSPTLNFCGTSLDLSTLVSSTTTTPLFEWNTTGTTPWSPIATPLTSFGNTDVYFKASSAATCDSINMVTITLVPTPTVSIQQDTTQICNGQVILTAVADGGYPSAPLSYRWTTGETTPSITVTQSTALNVSVNNTLNQNCFISDAANVTIPLPFTVSISSALACDDGKPFLLTATPSGQSTNNLGYSWTLNGQNKSFPQLSQILVSEAGVYGVTATDPGPGNCSATDMLNIVKAPVTPTTLSSAEVFCPDQGGITLDAGSGFISYLWGTGETTQTLQITQGGTYTLDATNSFGCVTSDQSEVLEDCVPKVFGPNAFRPGGLNNEFFLFTEFLDKFNIYIYSRWGELVYHSSDKDFRWDGTLNGELLPAGQYSYVVRYTSSFRDRGELVQYGGVTLLR